MSQLRKFIFDGLPVRGMLVRLEDDWREVLARRADGGAWPEPVRGVLGEMTAAAVLMQAGIRFDGALVLQVFGDGPVKVAVVEVQPDLAFRATAKVVGEVPAGTGVAPMFNAHGRGRCAITLDPRERGASRQPYQGVVPLHDATGAPLQQVAQVVEHYMQQSEQLDTRLVLAADAHCAAGLLVQRLPVQGQGNLEGQAAAERAAGDDAYERLSMLAATLGRDELLALPPDQVLRRLFWDEPLRVFDPQRPRFACNCSRDRVSGMLRSLGREESDSLIAERGMVEVGCDFCGRQYRFDAVDLDGLFRPAQDQPPASGAVQ